MQITQEIFDRFLENLISFIGGQRKDKQRILLSEFYFGGPKLSVSIDGLLVQYVYELPLIFNEPNEIFNQLVLDRWKAVSRLAIQGFIEGGSIGPHVDIHQSASLSALAGFPLLEDVLRRISNCWNEYGEATRPIGPEFGILLKGRKPKEYGIGERISSLPHKFQIAYFFFNNDMKKFWNEFDVATRRPSMKGLPDSDPILDRMYARRNSWAHGAEYEGTEGVLISLILTFIYIFTALHQNQNPIEIH